MTDRIYTSYTLLPGESKPPVIPVGHWGFFICDICGNPGKKTTKQQRSHQGACRVEHRKRYERKLAAKNRAKRARKQL